MRAEVKIPKGYRELKHAERVKINDLWLSLEEGWEEWVLVEEHMISDLYDREQSGIVIRKVKARR